MARGTEPGYRRQRKIYKLTFDKHPGLVVRATSVSAGDFLAITELTEQDMTPDVAKELFARFSSVLLDWNLQDEDGTPVPATPEGLLSEDWDFVMEILDAWMDAVAGVAAPLAQPSSGGSPSLMASIPMDVQSPSPPSSAML